MFRKILMELTDCKLSQACGTAMGVSLALSVAVVALIGAWPLLSEPQAKLTADDVARQFCVMPPPDAQVRPDGRFNKEFSLRVPDEVASNHSDSPSVVVQSGDVLKLTVSSHQAGAVGVHGLSTIEAIHPGESVVIKFRAIYSGRFPLHFHGTDGSHFELMAINVTANAGGGP